MKTIVSLGLAIGLVMPMTGWAWSAENEVLLRSYIRYSLAQEVLGQAQRLAEEVPEQEGAQIKQITEEWFGDEIDRMRQELDQRFGDRARPRFETFVSQFTQAENVQDAAYLDHLSQQVGLREPPADYGALRQLALERWLNEPLQAGTRLLSEMQTWAQVRDTQPDAPPLGYWLERELAAPEPAPRRPVNPLAAAEAPAPDWDAAAAPSGSALDSFAQRRRDRREQALQSAQAGMQQMAQERQAAEEEYAARVQADAQADAEAMRAHAQRLAAVEAEAMAQRENSWGNRIKRIVAGTVSAGVGAFTGGVGAEAGRRAADELFR